MAMEILSVEHALSDLLGFHLLFPLFAHYVSFFQTKNVKAFAFYVYSALVKNADLISEIPGMFSVQGFDLKANFVPNVDRKVVWPKCALAMLVQKAFSLKSRDILDRPLDILDHHLTLLTVT